jgi:hypothetical protein
VATRAAQDRPGASASELVIYAKAVSYDERRVTLCKNSFRGGRGARGIERESLWAVPVEDGYRIDNIPFYATGVAFGDIVAAEPDEDGVPRYTGIVTASRHSTIRLWFEKEVDVQRVRNELRKMDCPSELDLSRLLAVDVPHSVPFERIRVYLDGQEGSGILEYEEACLGQD